MNTSAKEGLTFQAAQFLFCSEDNAVAAALGQVLGGLGLLVQEVPALDTVSRRLGELAPSVVFLDFTADPVDVDQLMRSSDLARVLARVSPNLPRVAVGYSSRPVGAIAALRAGVSDFIDLSGKPEDAVDVVQHLLAFPGEASAGSGAQRSVLMLGARSGVGVSTLAVHAASFTQMRLHRWHEQRTGQPPLKQGKGEQEMLPLTERVSLLDIGYPVGDCLLYLNLTSDFDFAEAARNINRLDGTMLSAAMAHTASGINVMSLPRDLTQLRDLSFADSLSLYERLRQYSGIMLIDAGGHENIEFISQLGRACSDIWLVTDQSVSALVALDSLVAELGKQGIACERMRLVVNRYDERYGMDAGQIAQRFKLPLAGTLPDRTLSLMTCMNQGRLLHEVTDRDPYVKSVRYLVGNLMDERFVQPARPQGKLSAWMHGSRRRSASF
ncbi:MAG TPA: pilus assembly protein CpaE [Bordetella sp.]